MTAREKRSAGEKVGELSFLPGANASYASSSSRLKESGELRYPHVFNRSSKFYCFDFLICARCACCVRGQRSPIQIDFRFDSEVINFEHRIFPDVCTFSSAVLRENDCPSSRARICERTLCVCVCVSVFTVHGGEDASFKAALVRRTARIVELISRKPPSRPLNKSLGSSSPSLFPAGKC